MAEHVFTEGEKKCLEEYWQESGKSPRKNLIKLVSHINMFNPFPNEKSWEYIFYDRQLTDAQIDFALKMKLRKIYYIDELAKREGMSVEDTARMADELVHIGLLEYNCDDDGVDRVQLPVFAHPLLTVNRTAEVVQDNQQGNDKHNREQKQAQAEGGAEIESLF